MAVTGRMAWAAVAFFVTAATLAICVGLAASRAAAKEAAAPTSMDRARAQELRAELLELQVLGERIDALTELKKPHAEKVVRILAEAKIPIAEFGKAVHVNYDTGQIARMPPAEGPPGAGPPSAPAPPPPAAHK